jgi:molybdate transport system substrate-binding protein
MRVRSLIIALMAFGLVPPHATAQPRGEIRVWAARALATVLSEVGSEFEQASGYALVVTSDLPTGFAKRAAAGERFDILISMSPTVDQWINDGKVVAASRRDLARSGIGVAVRAGAPKPDISTVDAFKRALLDARSIAYLNVGSGIYLAGLLDRLGIADSIKSKVTRPNSDVVSELVAKGEIELGMVVITQIMTTEGVELVGPLPPEIQTSLTFSAGVSSTSRAPDVAKQLLVFLASPAATRVIRAQGMEPVP